MNARSLLSPALLLAAPLLFFSAFFVIPLIVVALASISDTEGNWTLAQYIRVLADNYHWEVILVTFRIGFITTLVCFILGYPLAWYVVRIVRLPAWRRICVILLIVPLFTSNIVRSFGWMVLLGRQGLVNDVLRNLEIIERPIGFLGTELGIIIGMVYILLPFMVLAVGNTLAQLDQSLEQASNDLGGNGPWTFWYITFPLSLPGIVSGAIMVFSMTISAYVTPALLSGGRVTVVSMLIFQQYSAVFDFNYGGALSVVLLVLTLLLIALTGWISSPRQRSVT